MGTEHARTAAEAFARAVLNLESLTKSRCEILAIDVGALSLMHEVAAVTKTRDAYLDATKDITAGAVRKACGHRKGSVFAVGMAAPPQISAFAPGEVTFCPPPPTRYLEARACIDCGSWWWAENCIVESPSLDKQMQEGIQRYLRLNRR